MKTPLEPAASKKLGISELLGNSGFLNQRVMQEIGSTYTTESTTGEYAGEFRFTSGRNAGPEARRLAIELDESRGPKPLATKNQNLQPAGQEDRLRKAERQRRRFATSAAAQKKAYKEKVGDRDAEKLLSL